jgi:hypothetical protein
VNIRNGERTIDKDLRTNISFSGRGEQTSHAKY